MSTPARIGVGVIGLGFMGRTHLRAYQAAQRDGLPCEVVAACDLETAKLADAAVPAQGNLSVDSRNESRSLQQVRCGSEPDELINDQRVHLVSVCTYTPTHVELAIKALQAGKHVLVEKPVALTSNEVRRLADATRRADTLCMPAMCMRFWPEWSWLHDRVRADDFGPLRSATFQRLGSMPNWAVDFYGDVGRSGGAIIDLHIHDVDFIYWCLGRPHSVRSAGDWNHVTTLYDFGPGGPHVVAEAALDLHPSAGFRMRFLANFEQATLDFDINRSPRLLLHRGEGSQAIELGELTGYDGEIRHIVGAIHDGRRELRATLDDAVAVAEILEAEQESLAAGAPDDSKPDRRSLS